MRAFEFLSEESSETYMIYVNSNPVMKYHDTYTLKTQLDLIRKKFPKSVFTVKQQTCKIEDIDPNNLR